MARVTGIGGIIFRADDPKALRTWYRDHLGVTTDGDDVASFYWRDRTDANRIGRTVWEVFDADASNFEGTDAPFMINYRVDDLDAVLRELRERGVRVVDRTVEFPGGRLGWVFDPEGHKVELWEPIGEPGQ